MADIRVHVFHTGEVCVAPALPFGGATGRVGAEFIVSGIADDKAAQLRSLEWIRAQSMDASCIESIANHDPDVKPHTIEL